MTRASWWFWSIGANWNRIIGTSLVNDLLIGVNDNSFNGTPIDLNGVGSLNNQLGIGGAQPIPGLTEVRMGNDLSNIGTIAIGSNTSNRVFQINEPFANEVSAELTECERPSSPRL